MIVREIETNKLYDAEYSDMYDEYWIIEGNLIMRALKPCEFRYLLYDREKEYIVEKDEEMR